MLDSKRHFNMNKFYKNPKTKWESTDDEEPSRKERKTTNQLLLFCDLILTYEKYKPYKEEMNDSAYSASNSDQTNDSFSSSESNSSFNNNDSANEDVKNSDTDTESDSFNLITCYCMKPFANRPMIECSVCGTWLHMSCAIVRSNNIPEHFVCQVCREAKGSSRRSARIKSTDRRFFHHS